MLVCMFFSFYLFMLLCVSPLAYTIYMFHTLTTLLVLKVPLNTNQPSNSPNNYDDDDDDDDSDAYIIVQADAES